LSERSSQTPNNQTNQQNNYIVKPVEIFSTKNNTRI
jgi:hypothetical protein